MTEGPQQPHNPDRGRTAPPGPHSASRTPAGERPALRGDLAGGPGLRAPRPDWAALADRAERARYRARRRRLALTGGGVLAAVAAVTGIVATAVAGSSAPSGVALPPAPSSSGVSAPPLDPLAYISDRGKDTAPLTVAGLFPGRQLVRGGRTYTKTGAEEGNCSSATSAELAAVLRRNGCGRLLRVTYTGGRAAVTVGVAVFGDPSAAGRAKSQAEGYLKPLPGGGAGAFCRATSCRTTSNATGRYAYFTIAGLKNNARVTASDTVARQAGTDGSDYAFHRIVQRGRSQAAAAATSATASPDN
ncbi:MULTISPECIES: hypothetical protein [unclassified Streptomyces]|uniref:hypothetical protein n=1 Tax=unclassified Streptomyces TaxID=2593676 RepID=UPI0037F39599